jgi:hypothetical protein
MKTVTAKELKDKLHKEKNVSVNGYNFRIRKVPLLLLSEDVDNLWDSARQGKETLTQKIHSLISHPTLPMLKAVLLAGVIQPVFSDVDGEDRVNVDMVLAHHELSVALFLEIVNFSLEG